ncbi:MAG: hypothetical protein QN229_03235 [Desulfurococcaceae archaeon TW002]
MLEEAVIDALKTLKSTTFEELRKYLREEKKEEFLDLELRRVLVKLIKEGKVEKIPDPRKNKFLFSVRSY